MLSLVRPIARQLHPGLASASERKYIAAVMDLPARRVQERSFSFAGSSMKRCCCGNLGSNKFGIVAFVWRRKAFNNAIDRNTSGL